MTSFSPSPHGEAVVNAARYLQAHAFTRPRHARPRSGIGDALVGGVFAAASALAAPVAAIDAMLRPDRTARARARLRDVYDGRTDGTGELRSIWFARIAREGLHALLVIGFAEAVLRRVDVTGGVYGAKRNCVYAIYHTPWGRVLALWLARQPDGIVFSAHRWLDRAGRAHLPCTWRGLRELVQRIRSGGSAAVTADHFSAPPDHSTPASILGCPVRVSTGVARIALAAGVPIVPVTARFYGGRLQIAVGAEIAVDRSGIDSATRRMTSVFDAELRRDPSGWEQAHRFLSAA